MSKNVKNKSKEKNTHNDILAKILSVAAAVILWFYVVDTQTTISEKAIYGVPVVVSNFDDTIGLSLVEGMDNTVDIMVKGEKSEIDDLTQEDIKAFVDLTGVTTSGKLTREIKINTPSGITIVNRTPRQMNLELEKTGHVDFGIRVNITNYSISEDYTIGTPELEFDTVRVSGPERYLDSVSGAEIRLNLGRLEGNRIEKGTIILVDADGKQVVNPYLYLDKVSAEVKIPVKKVAIEE